MGFLGAELKEGEVMPLTPSFPGTSGYLQGPGEGCRLDLLQSWVSGRIQGLAAGPHLKYIFILCVCVSDT